MKDDLIMKKCTTLLTLTLLSTSTLMPSIVSATEIKQAVSLSSKQENTALQTNQSFLSTPISQTISNTSEISSAPSDSTKETTTEATSANTSSSIKNIASSKASPTTLDNKITSLDESTDSIDVSQGWEIINYNSDTLPDVNDTFLQGVETTTNQKCALVQAGNVGDASFTAQKVIPMKKGHQYDLNLIYAQTYDSPSTGFIDFNGDKIVATDDPTDKEYRKTITPTEDMDYTITVSFTTVYPGNAYLKVGYDKTGDGITVHNPQDVTAKYVDTDGNSISDDVIMSGNIGDNYTT